jgi:hypothetical protein
MVLWLGLVSAPSLRTERAREKGQPQGLALQNPVTKSENSCFVLPKAIDSRQLFFGFKIEGHTLHLDNRIVISHPDALRYIEINRCVAEYRLNAGID